MIKTEFIRLYEELNEINEARRKSTPKLDIVSVEESVQESDDHDPKRHIMRVQFYDPQEPTIMPRINMEFEFKRDLDNPDPDARKANPHYGKWFEYADRAYDYDGNLLPDINPDDERTETEMRMLGNIHQQLVDDGIIDESFLDDLEADTNIYTVDGIDYNAEDLYAAIFDSIDSYRFDADNEDEYVEISQQEAEEIAHEAFYELTDSNCKKPIYEVVAELLGL